ncbi:hypothetical protein [Burkholderia pseudomallei]|uniref:hypothetical protein n=1 Tax=Burkholderia pseudomallei TaxID=28450 RepID=UPI00057213A2|nr:hypothetical protein [Burkholderia pseudomallei]MBM5645466.1 hypothetical protein [Burkholderia pseudomallei]ONC60982.1 hypothetical protein AQ919_04985 [Burkholderia pseudomallei]ONC70732.1 hypothetical protein AQ921_18520 [Burkholderia pseudomallei]
MGPLARSCRPGGGGAEVRRRAGRRGSGADAPGIGVQGDRIGSADCAGRMAIERGARAKRASAAVRVAHADVTRARSTRAG